MQLEYHLLFYPYPANFLSRKCLVLFTSLTYTMYSKAIQNSFVREAKTKKQSDLGSYYLQPKPPGYKQATIVVISGNI